MVDKQTNETYYTSNDSSGNVMFDKHITYSLSDVDKTFTYTIEEISDPNSTVYNYDPRIYTIKITPRYYGGYSLNEDVQITDNTGKTYNRIEFKNSMKPRNDITVKKVIQILGNGSYPANYKDQLFDIKVIGYKRDGSTSTYLSLIHI